MGTYYDNLRVPDLLLTVFYCQDTKTGNLVKDKIKFVFQTDGPSDADLNFPHFTLTTSFAHQICNFEVKMDIVFGAGVTNKLGGNIGGNLGMEKVVKGGVEATVEKSTESPGTRTIIHARIVGTLNVRAKALDAVEEMTGSANQHRSY